MNKIPVLAASVLWLCLAGCRPEGRTITSLEMLEGGKTFAVPTGTVADQMVLKRFPDAKIIYYNTILDCALAVRDGKADATSYDLPVLKNIAAKNQGVMVLSELLEDDRYGFAVQPENQALKAAIDTVLHRMKADGTYNDMMARWFPEKGSPAPMPEFQFSGENGILRFGTAAVTEPMSFYDASRKPVGFDIEFASRVALYMGKKTEITDMEFGAMLPALIAGKVDMIGAGLSITEERAKSVLFSESYYPSGIAALVKRPPAQAMSPPKQKFSSEEDIKDKRIGVLLGSVGDTYAKNNYPEARLSEFQTVPDLTLAMVSGKIDAAIFNDAFLAEILQNYEEIGILQRGVITNPIGAGFNKNNPELRSQFNAFLGEIKANGILEDMEDRWVKQQNKEMPAIESSNKNGILKVGIDKNMGMPFAFLYNGNLAGLDIELAERFAAYLGKTFVPVDLVFATMLAALKTDKIDVAACCMTITEERQKEIDFSNPYFISGTSLIALKKNIEKSAKLRLGQTEDIRDKKIGVLMGSIQDMFAKRDFPDAAILQYQNVTDMLTAVKLNKVDVGFADHVGLKEIFAKNPDLGLFAANLYTVPIAAAFNENNDGLREKFNVFLKEIKSDGVYDDMVSRWMDLGETTMPGIDVGGTNGTLRNGIVSDGGLPFTILKDGKLAGFDIELSMRFAASQGMAYEPIDIPFGSMIASIVTNKVDITTCSMMITEEREKQVDFSDPYYASGVSLFALKENISGLDATEHKVKKSFLQAAGESFHSNIILEKRYLLILDGLKLTILITLFSALLGTLFGGVICYMRMSASRLLQSAARLYISLLRGTPVLVLLMIIYYVVFASVNINPALVAVLAFGLNFGAYVSEMFRTSIESVDKGQQEAGIAGGFTKLQTFMHIIMPQALRRVLPVYKGEFISLLKMTSIVGYIAVQDLTKASDIIRSRTFDAFFPLIMAAVLYLVLAWLLSWGLSRIEFSVDPKHKQRSIAKEKGK